MSILFGLSASCPLLPSSLPSQRRHGYHTHLDSMLWREMLHSVTCTHCTSVHIKCSQCYTVLHGVTQSLMLQVALTRCWLESAGTYGKKPTECPLQHLLLQSSQENGSLFLATPLPTLCCRGLRGCVWEKE